MLLGHHAQLEAYVCGMSCVGLVARFEIVAACFGGHCVTVGVCHCLIKSDMFGCQCVL